MRGCVLLLGSVLCCCSRSVNSHHVFSACILFLRSAAGNGEALHPALRRIVDSAMQRLPAETKRDLQRARGDFLSQLLQRASSCWRTTIIQQWELSARVLLVAHIVDTYPELASAMSLTLNGMCAPWSEDSGALLEHTALHLLKSAKEDIGIALRRLAKSEDDEPGDAEEEADDENNDEGDGEHGGSADAAVSPSAFAQAAAKQRSALSSDLQQQLQAACDWTAE